MNILHFITLKQDVAYLYTDYTLRQTLEKMEYHRYSAIPIIDRDGVYVGTITEGDLLWAVKDRSDLNLWTAAAVGLMDIPRRMDYQPVSVNTDMEDLIHKALNQNFVPVVDDRGVFIGIITRKSIIQYYYDRTAVFVEPEKMALSR